MKNTGIFDKLAIVGYAKSYQPYSRIIDYYISNAQWLYILYYRIFISNNVNFAHA